MVAITFIQNPGKLPPIGTPFFSIHNSDHGFEGDLLKRKTKFQTFK